MLTCDKCCSTIPDEMWKKDIMGNMTCPVCGHARVGLNAEKVKVSLKKDDETVVEVPVQPSWGSSQKGQQITASGLLDAVDSGFKKVFGSAVQPCQGCGRIICICSLKQTFGK